MILANIIKHQATMKIVRVRNDFLHHSQILLSLCMNQKWSQLLQNSFNCLHIIGDSPQLFNSKLTSYSPFQLSDLLCFCVELQFCDQNYLVQNGVPLYLRIWPDVCNCNGRPCLVVLSCTWEFTFNCLFTSHMMYVPFLCSQISIRCTSKKSDHKYCVQDQFHCMHGTLYQLKTGLNNIFQ